VNVTIDVNYLRWFHTLWAKFVNVSEIDESWYKYFSKHALSVSRFYFINNVTAPASERVEKP